MESSRRVGIIGAGISGLIAAVHLSKLGHQVYLFERAKYPGGAAGHYIRKGVQYPTGATLTFGMEPGGPLRQLLESAGVSFTTVPTVHSMDVALSDRTVHVYSDRRAWRNELHRAFPERAEAVLHFWHHLDQVAETVYTVAKTFAGLPLRRFADFGRLPAAILREPSHFLRLTPERLWTVDDALRRHGLEDYEPLRRFLNAQLIDAAQTDCASAAWLPASIALDIYRRGVHLVSGGLPALMQGCVEWATEHGAKVHFSRTVQLANYDRHKRVWTLTTNRRESFEVDHVIHATGTPIPGDAEGVGYLDAAETSVPNWGAIRLDTLVRGAWTSSLRLPVDTTQQPFAFQIANDEAIGHLLKDKDGAVYVTIHPLDVRQPLPQQSPMEIDDVNVNRTSEYQVITVSVHTPVDDWIGLSKEAYERKKSEAAEAIIERVDHVLNGYRSEIRHLLVGTPKTYERYLGKPRVGGTPLTVDNSVRRPVGPRTSLPGWLLAGDSVFPGPGTLSSAISGFIAARCIDKSVMKHVNG